MRVVKVLRGYSCWKRGMEPIPDVQGFLVQDNETVRFFNPDAFRPFGTDELKEVVKHKTEPAIHARIDWLIDVKPRNTQRDRNARNTYFNTVFDHI